MPIAVGKADLAEMGSQFDRQKHLFPAGNLTVDAVSHQEHQKPIDEETAVSMPAGVLPQGQLRRCSAHHGQPSVRHSVDQVTNPGGTVVIVVMVKIDSILRKNIVVEEPGHLQAPGRGQSQDLNIDGTVKTTVPGQLPVGRESTNQEVEPAHGKVEEKILLLKGKEPIVVEPGEPGSCIFDHHRRVTPPAVQGIPRLNGDQLDAQIFSTARPGRPGSGIQCKNRSRYQQHQDNKEQQPLFSFMHRYWSTFK